MYYFLIALSVVMFGGSFAVTDAYRAERGSSLRVSLQYSLIGAVGGLAVLLPMNGFSVSPAPFALILALCSVLVGFAFTFCSFKALGSINLSMYSLFSMLGGMLLPFLQGIFFYGEDFTVAKALCLLLISLSLLLTLKKGDGTKKGGGIYYVLVFILNGLSGVISKLFASAPEEWKTAASGNPVDSTDYSIIKAACSIAVSALLLIILKKPEGERPINKKSVVLATLGGSVNKVANWILVLALAGGIDASVQYPFVTGGTMIVSTAICFFGKKKPNGRELLSVCLAFLGLLCMFLIPKL